MEEGPRPKDVCNAAKAPELACAGATAISRRGSQNSQNANLLSLSLSVSVSFHRSLGKQVLSTGSVPCPVLRRLRGAHSLGKEMHGSSSGCCRDAARRQGRPAGEAGACFASCPAAVLGPALGSQPWEVSHRQGRDQGRDAVATHTVDGGLQAGVLT